MASVPLLIVIFRGFILLVHKQTYIGFLLLFWWPVPYLFILLCCNMNTANEWMVIDYTCELTFHSSSDLFSVTEFPFMSSLRRWTVSLLSNNNKFHKVKVCLLWYSLVDILLNLYILPYKYCDCILHCSPLLHRGYGWRPLTAFLALDV